MTECEYCKNTVATGASACQSCGHNPNGKTALAAGIAGALLYPVLAPVIRWLVVFFVLSMTVPLKWHFLYNSIGALSALILIVIDKHLQKRSKWGTVCNWLLLALGIGVVIEKTFIL